MMTTQCIPRQKSDVVDECMQHTPPLLIREHLPVIFQQLPAGVIILDQHGTVIGYNPAAIDLVGEPLFAQSWWQVIQRAFVKIGETNCDLALEDGRVVNLQTCPMGDTPGQIILLHEVTQVRALEGRIQRYQQLSNSGEVAARLAHQLRTPLSVALLYCDQLSDPSLSDDKRQIFGQKMKARLLNIESHINDMLMLVNVPDENEFTLVSMQDFAEMLTQQCDKEFPYNNIVCNIEVSCRLHTPSMIGVVTNCLNNAYAAQATQSKISFGLNHKQRSCLITIEDNGVGMPDSVRQQACQAFYSTKKQGTGLGLAVAKSVLMAHGGSVNIYSEKNKGTSVELVLPIME